MQYASITLAILVNKVIKYVHNIENFEKSFQQFFKARPVETRRDSLGLETDTALCLISILRDETGPI